MGEETKKLISDSINCFQYLFDNKIEEIFFFWISFGKIFDRKEEEIRKEYGPSCSERKNFLNHFFMRKFFL